MKPLKGARPDPAAIMIIGVEAGGRWKDEIEGLMEMGTLSPERRVERWDVATPMCWPL